MHISIQKNTQEAISTHLILPLGMDLFIKLTQILDTMPTNEQKQMIVTHIAQKNWPNRYHYVNHSYNAILYNNV